MPPTKFPNNREFLYYAVMLALLLTLVSCKGSSADQPTAVAAPAAAPAATASAAQPPPTTTCKTPPPATFSGDCAFDQVAKQVSFGPRPPASDAIRRLQDYMVGQLKGFGCQVDTHDFHASTPIGSVAMKNIVVKIPGASPNIILLATHYDTDTVGPPPQLRKMSNFVGADDAGSSTGIMLEMARVLCGKPQAATIWIAFFDGEEALKDWTDTDSVYGSREMAATMALSGDLARVKALVLADLVGGKNFHAKRDSETTQWLQDVVWDTAARLGHKDLFVSEHGDGMEDDHLPWKARKIPTVDIIDLDISGDVNYWHTEQDTLDKISPKTLQAVGDVIFASLPEIAKRIK